MTTLKIGELARALEVPVETVRYYEREQLLQKPARTGGNYRLYTPQDRERLEFILHCRALDMTLQEIRHLLRLRDAPEHGCGEVNTILDAHIEHVADRMRALRRLQSELKAIRARCDAPTTTKACGVLRELSAAPSVRAVSKSHVGRTRCAG